VTSLLTERPLNDETPLGELAHPRTPTPHFYRRSNFEIPELDAATWSLPVTGEVQAPLEVTWDDLHALPRREVSVTLECAGIGRSLVSPLPPGHPWGLCALSTGTFAGVSFRDLLARVRPNADAVEVLFVGADAGEVEPGRRVTFERSLPLDALQDPDVILAWEMNGEPLPREHGAPLRLVVPRWYGVASVKWLVEVRVLAEPFRGHFQAERYVYIADPEVPDETPVTVMRVRALTVQPQAGASFAAGEPVRVSGIAWSGEAPVQAVEVSTDGGATWSPAVLGEAPSPYAAAPWAFDWTPADAGGYELMARATDGAGNTQPMEPVHNDLGYGNNAVQRVPVRVRAG
jgi:DMSO/TMAO reductase YedYZ molybdopterin-dependent catalytic subunit